LNFAESSKDDLPKPSFRYAVKDCIDVKGTPTSCGVSPPITAVAECDAQIVALLNARGDQLVAKTNLDELSLGCLGTNGFYGDVLNPTHPEYICGGSSAGSAALVAAGRVEIGVGTDWGGSTRIPALCCGVYGLKVTALARFSTGVEHIDPSMSALGFLTGDLDTLLDLLAWIGLDGGESESDLQVSAACEHEADEDFRFATGPCGQFIKEIFGDKSPLARVALPWEDARRCRKVLAAQAFKGFAARRALSEAYLPEQARALLLLAGTPDFGRLVDRAESERRRISDAVMELFKGSPVIVCPGLGVPVPRCSDIAAATRFSDHCTYFFEIANVADVSSLVFPFGGLGEGVQLLIRPGWEGAALRWLRRLRIQGGAPI
jgi:Asp-tRNA(Asn)/Glu-tRNA(Gln) amidotransferase A subunit family amidase